MGSAFGGVALEKTIHSEAFPGGAEQRQEHDGDGVEEQQPLAPLRVGDAQRAEAHAEAFVAVEAALFRSLPANDQSAKLAATQEPKSMGRR